MSGHAATALAIRTIEDSSELHPANRLGKAIPPSQGKSPFSLDGYLSWMSRKGLSIFLSLRFFGIFVFSVAVQRYAATLTPKDDFNWPQFFWCFSGVK
jgi:hypothetical protein